MSRPQYGQHQQSQAPVVNGGLIDFQDNQYRGLSEYASFSGIGPNNAYPVPNVGQPASLHPYMLAGPVGHAPCGPGHFQPPHGVAAGFVPVPVPPHHTVQSNGPAVPSQFAVPGPSQGAPAGQYVNGPPSFVQINGVKYRPVDDPSAKASVSAAPNLNPVQGPVETEVAVMSEQELENAIDRRVQEQVEAFISGQRKGNVGSQDVSSTRRAPSASSNSKRVEEKMARQVASVNATMRSAGPVVVKRGW